MNWQKNKILCYLESEECENNRVSQYNSQQIYNTLNNKYHNVNKKSNLINKEIKLDINNNNKNEEYVYNILNEFTIKGDLLEENNDEFITYLYDNLYYLYLLMYKIK